MTADEARRLWETWLRPFPPGWADVEVNSESRWPLAYLDHECAASLARHFGGFGFRGGELDSDNRRFLVQMRPDIERVVVAAAGDDAARSYFEDLLALIDDVLAATG